MVEFILLVLSSSCLSMASSCIDENDFLGDFRPENSKIYLSRQWKEYIKCVDQKFTGGVSAEIVYVCNCGGFFVCVCEK